MPIINIFYEWRNSGEWQPGNLVFVTADGAEFTVARMRENPNTYRNIHVAWSEPAAVTASSAPAAVPAEILTTLRTVLASVRAYDDVLMEPITKGNRYWWEAIRTSADYDTLLRMLTPLYELIGDAAPGAPSAADDV